MKAKALICSDKQDFSVEDVVLPEPSPDQVTVRTYHTGVSIGTEFALVRGKLSWGPYPICTGYMGTGVIEAVGANVEGLRIGDEVYFRRNDAMSLADGAPVSCVSGAHCSHIVTRPDTIHGVAKVDRAAMDVACMFVVAAVGFHATDIVAAGIGQKVVVHGTGQIGIAVVAACALRGCEIIAVDIDGKRLGIAEEMGADHLINGATQDVELEVKRIAPDGADIVFECTGLPQCIDPAIALCRKHGSFVWAGNYGSAPVSMRFLPAHTRQLRMFMPCDDGYQPCRRAVIKNMAMGTLKWDRCITHRIQYTESPAMFRRINEGKAQDALGVVINWLD